MVLDEGGSMTSPPKSVLALILIVISGLLSFVSPTFILFSVSIVLAITSGILVYLDYRERIELLVMEQGIRIGNRMRRPRLLLILSNLGIIWLTLTSLIFAPATFGVSEILPDAFYQPPLLGLFEITGVLKWRLMLTVVHYPLTAALIIGYWYYSKEVISA